MVFYLCTDVLITLVFSVLFDDYNNLLTKNPKKTILNGCCQYNFWKREQPNMSIDTERAKTQLYVCKINLFIVFPPEEKKTKLIPNNSLRAELSFNQL